MLNISIESPVNSDAALVALAKDGDRPAFEQLISRHYQTCVNMASFMLHDRGEAQDQVQEACWKAFEHLDQYHGDAEFVSWMLRIVVNQCLMLLRVRRRTHFCYLDDNGSQNGARPIELPDKTPDPEHEVVSWELGELLRNEISHIPPLLRNVILLRAPSGVANERGCGAPGNLRCCRQIAAAPGSYRASKQSFGKIRRPETSPSGWVEAAGEVPPPRGLDELTPSNFVAVLWSQLVESTVGTRGSH